MGMGAGLNFNANPPTAIATAMNASEGCASLSNGEYGLKFYTNGKTVWNALGNIMPNGGDIVGPAHSTMSTTQAAVIVPAPGSTRYYYVFSLTDNTQKLFCNRVDMTLANGIGDIDTGFPLRGIVLHDSLSEKMIAVPGCNSNVWLLVFGDYGKVLAYEITTAGISTTPVVSVIGHGAKFGTGVAKVSPKADRIAVCNTAVGSTVVLALLNFDYTNGTATFNRVVDSLRSYGCAFSPDGTKLYTYDPNGSKLKQLNLDVPYPGASGILLGIGVPTDLKLAVDGKVYFFSMNGTGSMLGRIEDPNVLGTAAGYHDTAVNLGAGSVLSGFPNDVVLAGNIPPGGINRVALDTVLCHMPASGVQLKAIPASGGYIWDNSSSSGTRTITQTGTYYVRYNTVCGPRVDTFKVRSGSFHASLQFNNPVLRTEPGYAHYQWYKGDTLQTGTAGSELVISSNGRYSVVVENEWGCRDSVSMQVTGYLAIDEPEQLSRLTTIYPNPASDHVYIKAPIAISFTLCSVDGKVQLSGKDSRVNTNQLAKGLYLLHIYDRKGNRIKTEKVVKL